MFNIAIPSSPQVFMVQVYSLQKWLLRLAKHASLIQLYTISPASLIQLYAIACLTVQFYVINMLSSQGAAASPSENPVHLNPAFLYRCPYVSVLLPLLGQTLKLCKDSDKHLNSGDKRAFIFMWSLFTFFSCHYP